jgi:hypothetical protein
MHLMHHASFCASACKVVRLVYLVFDDGKIDLVVVSESRLTFIQLSPIGTDARVSTGREDFHRYGSSVGTRVSRFRTERTALSFVSCHPHQLARNLVVKRSRVT